LGRGNERVPQGIWSDRFSNSGTAGNPANDPPGSVPVKTVSIGSHKDWSFAALHRPHGALLAVPAAQAVRDGWAVGWLPDTILFTPQPAWPELDVDTGCMRIAIRVKPGSARPGVGGEHDGALVVRVSARAVDGKATEAALAAVAASFGVRRSAVRLVSGASSRTKIVDIDADDPRILAALLAAPGRLRPQQDAAAVRPSVMSAVIAGSAATHPRVAAGDG
jgi:hypothetical protein